MSVTRRAVADESLSALYQQDYCRWLLANARLLRAGRLTDIDIDHLAEELEDMGRSEQRAVASHLVVLLQHLLKWQFQPERRGASWQVSINNARDAIRDLLAESPSLRPGLAGLVAAKYPVARRNAVAETGLAAGAFPEQCPYSIAELADDGFLPGDAAPSPPGATG